MSLIVPDNSKLVLGNATLVDLHVNGVTLPPRIGQEAVVVSFSAPNLDLESVRLATEELVKRGTNYFLATVITGDPEVTIRNLRILARAMKEPWGKAILGIHLEGPWFSLVCKGAHPAPYVREIPDIALFERFVEAADQKVVLSTLSPALRGAPKFIEQMRSLGVTVSLGHHDACTSQIREAFAAGATGVTHAGNGWSKAPAPNGRRNTEVLAQLAAKDVFVMVIPDGEHVEPDFIRYVCEIVETMRPGHIVWVSDCSPLAGAPEGEYELYSGLKAVISRGEDGKLRGKPLTGSYLLLKDCLKELAASNIVPLDALLPPASRNPVEFVRKSLERCGTFPNLGGFEENLSLGKGAPV